MAKCSQQRSAREYAPGRVLVLARDLAVQPAVFFFFFFFFLALGSKSAPGAASRFYKFFFFFFFFLALGSKSAPGAASRLQKVSLKSLSRQALIFLKRSSRVGRGAPPPVGPARTAAAVAGRPSEQRRHKERQKSEGLVSPTLAVRAAVPPPLARPIPGGSHTPLLPGDRGPGRLRLPPLVRRRARGRDEVRSRLAAGGRGRPPRRRRRAPPAKRSVGRQVGRQVGRPAAGGRRAGGELAPLLRDLAPLEGSLARRRRRRACGLFH